MSRFWASDHKSEAACHINRLPPDLLSLIFTISVDESSHYLDSNFVPFTLTHVCTLWRDVAVNLPQLWQRFKLLQCWTKSSHADLASMCAQRAGGLELDISYEESPDEDYYDPSWYYCNGSLCFCLCRLELICRLMKQIKHLRLYIGVISTGFLASAIQENPACILESLAVMFSCDVSIPTCLQLAPLLSSPKLQTFGWSLDREYCTTGPTVAVPNDVPWHQLVSIDLTHCLLTHDACLAIIGAAQEARSISVHIKTTHMKTLDTAAASLACQRVCNKSLESLGIVGDEPLDKTFSVLILPALRRLGIQICDCLGHHDDPEGWPLMDPSLLARLVQTVDGEMEELTVNACPGLDESTLIGCIEQPQMATLRKLHLTNIVLTKQFIHSLHTESSDGLRLPHLEDLSLGTCATVDGVVAEMLRIRRSLSDSLQMIEFLFDETDAHEFDKAFIEGYYEL